jgi:hypothetical protein
MDTDGHLSLPQCQSHFPQSTVADLQDRCQLGSQHCHCPLGQDQSDTSYIPASGHWFEVEVQFIHPTHRLY